MSKIRIYSKKAFDIGPGADRETSKVESFLTRDDANYPQSLRAWFFPGNAR